MLTKVKDFLFANLKTSKTHLFGYCSTVQIKFTSRFKRVPYQCKTNWLKSKEWFFMQCEKRKSKKNTKKQKLFLLHLLSRSANSQSRNLSVYVPLNEKPDISSKTLVRSNCLGKIFSGDLQKSDPQNLFLQTQFTFLSGHLQKLVLFLIPVISKQRLLVNQDKQEILKRRALGPTQSFQGQFPRPMFLFLMIVQEQQHKVNLKNAKQIHVICLLQNEKYFSFEIFSSKKWEYEQNKIIQVRLNFPSPIHHHPPLLTTTQIYPPSSIPPIITTQTEAIQRQFLTFF